MKPFDDITAVVTGAGAGIGKALALEAALRGANVAVTDIQLDAAQAVADEITAMGRQAAAFQVDVSDAAAVTALAAQVAARFGTVNLLFNNAGVYAWGTLEKTKPENLAWLFNVNVFGAAYVFQAFLPLIRQADAAGQFAHVAATGSENSICAPDPANGTHTAYTASKHAVLGMTDALRRDLADTNIGVSIICPGVVSTMLWNSARVRQDRFGGPREAPPANAELTTPTARQAPEVARLALDGVAAGEFMIVTDPAIAPFAEQRRTDIANAFTALKSRL